MNHPCMLNIFSGGQLVYQDVFDDAMLAMDRLTKMVLRRKGFEFEYAQCLLCDPNKDPVEQWRFDVR